MYCPYLGCFVVFAFCGGSFFEKNNWDWLYCCFSSCLLPERQLIPFPPPPEKASFGDMFLSLFLLLFFWLLLLFLWLLLPLNVSLRPYFQFLLVFIFLLRLFCCFFALLVLFYYCWLLLVSAYGSCCFGSHGFFFQSSSCSSFSFFFFFFLHVLFVSHLLVLLWVYFLISSFVLWLVFILDVLSLCFACCCLVWSCSCCFGVLLSIAFATFWLLWFVFVF